MLQQIDRYLLRQIATPLVMTLCVAAMLLLMERMVRLFDFVVNQSGPVDVVWRMLANLVPHYMGLALPIGLFLGVLLAFRKLALNSELDALTSSGAGIPRLLRGVMVLALALAALNLLLVGYIQPYSRYAYRGLEFDLRSGALGASIKVGDFVSIADNVTLRIEESRRGGRELGGVFLQRTLPNGNQIVVTAEKGAFFSSQDNQTVILRLQNGRMLDLNVDKNKPRVLTFDSQDIALELPEFAEFRDRGGEELELTLDELVRDTLNPPPPASQRPSSIQQAEEYHHAVVGNLHWRLIHSLTFLVLPFLGIAMGVTSKRTGSAVGIVLGLTLVIVYHELLEASETAVARGSANPWLVMWGNFAIFSALSFYFFWLVAYVPGGNPTAWLDRFWLLVKKPILRLTRRLEDAM